MYQATDGRQLVLAVGSDGQFRQLCEALHQPNWASDNRFATNAARVAHRAELEVLLTQRIAVVAGDALLAELERRAVPAGAVRSVGEALRQASAQAMLLPTTAGAGAGLRTVAFRSSAWAAVHQLSTPPGLGSANDSGFSPQSATENETRAVLPCVPPVL